jgi:hypothetical protein
MCTGASEPMHPQPTGGFARAPPVESRAVTRLRGRAAQPVAGDDGPLTNWTEGQAASLTSSVVQTTHRLADLDVLTDESLDGHRR